MKKYLQGFLAAGLIFIVVGAGAAIVTGTGIFGTQTNDNAGTGYIGEYQTSSLISASAVSLTAASASNITSVTLGAGDWDVSGTACFHSGATTVIADEKQGVGTGTTATSLSTLGGFNYFYISSQVGATDDSCQPTPTQRISLAASAVAWLSAQADFTTSTLASYGVIRARRVR